MQASRARLFKELKEVQREKSADPDIKLICDDSNIFKWTALIKGPTETPYEGGVFQLALAVPEQYPLQPPQVRFLTKIFHPNVHFKAIFCAREINEVSTPWLGCTRDWQQCPKRVKTYASENYRFNMCGLTDAGLNKVDLRSIQVNASGAFYVCRETSPCTAK